jgi:hypothetical protein
MSDTRTLADELPAQMARVRDHVLSYYLAPELNGAGMIAATLMRASLDAAAKAMMSGDVVEMIRCCEDLKGYET